MVSQLHYERRNVNNSHSVVCLLDDVVLVLELDDDDDRTEDLLLGDLRVARYTAREREDHQTSYFGLFCEERKTHSVKMVGWMK